MNGSILVPPSLDDDAVVTLHDFLYELLDSFEVHYGYQLTRYSQSERRQRLNDRSLKLPNPEDGVPF